MTVIQINIDERQFQTKWTFEILCLITPTACTSLFVGHVITIYPKYTSLHHMRNTKLPLLLLSAKRSHRGTTDFQYTQEMQPGEFTKATATFKMGKLQLWMTSILDIALKCSPWGFKPKYCQVSRQPIVESTKMSIPWLQCVTQPTVSSHPLMNAYAKTSFHDCPNRTIAVQSNGSGYDVRVVCFQWIKVTTLLTPWMTL